MLPTELSHLAQERCKELRGEIRRPDTSFFEFSPKKMLANFFKNLGDKTATQPQARGTKVTEL